MPIATAWSRLKPSAASDSAKICLSSLRNSNLKQSAPSSNRIARFLSLVRSHTLQGYYGSPRHGGNRNAVSWRMLGLDEPLLRGRAQYDLKKGTHS